MKDCKAIGTLHRRIGDRKYYKKYCTKHNKLKYGIRPSSKFHNYFFEKLKNNRKNLCQLCKWVGKTHFHRIIPGKYGGRYVEGNVIEVCPNCHTLEHRGLISLQTK